ncbi:hypothetical protein BUE80_DR001304 [Diplocarpon rosae]|nr:hypothetical protein BUE80_DR001304 [Diplocarpon rosae]
MAEARIVYEGDVGSGQGDLFLGMKFHLAMRLPSRGIWKDLIEQNGGIITKLDSKPGVIKIADHARKDCPQGSISWKWIDASVKKGSLEDFEDYRAGPAELRDQPAGSEQPTRNGRVPFSQIDDKILMAYCTRAEQNGASMGGNQIYREFAHKYPRHTAQSWRDRWLKKLQFCKRPELEEEDDQSEEGEEGETNHKSIASKSPSARQSQTGRPANKPSIPRAAPAHTQAHKNPHRTNSMPSHTSTTSPVNSERSHTSHVPRAFEANPFILESDGGNVFTDEETDLLFEHYDSIMELNDDQIIDAWIAWSVANPNHTPQEWRNYFKEYIVPSRNDEIEKKKRRERQAKKMAPANSIHVEADLQCRQSFSKPGPKKLQGLKDHKDTTRHTIEPPTTLDDNVDPCLIDRDEFELNLQLVADRLGLEVEFEPVICDRKVSLFELWQVVKSPDFGGFDEVTGQELWWKVASELQFEPNTSAANDLKICYSEILADFETIREEFFDKVESSGSHDEAMIEDQLRLTARQTESMDSVRSSTGDQDETGGFGEAVEEQGEDLDKELTPNRGPNGGHNGRGHHHKIHKLSRETMEELQNEHEEYDDDLEYPQISPHRPELTSSSAGKRKLGSGRQPRSPLLGKKQRVSKGKEREIPSTPEDVIKNSQNFRESHQPSPLKFAELPSESDSSSVEAIMPTNLERQEPVTRKRALAFEPETQDFHFPQPSQYLNPPQRSIDDDASEEEVSLLVSPLRGSCPPQSKDTDEDEDEDEDEGIILDRQSSQKIAGAPSERENPKTFTTPDSLRSSSNNYESSTQSQTEAEKNEQLLAFINKSVSDGYAYDIVMEALTATTMSVKEALKVMESLADGDGIPEDIPGVWTKWDDDALQASKDTQNYQIILRKHGLPRVVLRKRYLRDTKAVNGG